ncbi:MAG: hypothetical protein WAK10_08760 [Methanoregula sp.]
MRGKAPALQGNPALFKEEGSTSHELSLFGECHYRGGGSRSHGVDPWNMKGIS